MFPFIKPSYAPTKQRPFLVYRIIQLSYVPHPLIADIGLLERVDGRELYLP